MIALVLGIVGYVVYQYLQCKRKGRESGQAYRCKLFCGEPDFRLLEEEYYTMREGKCYRVFDYGETMSIRRVDLINCEEQDEPKKSDIVEEVEYY